MSAAPLDTVLHFLRLLHSAADAEKSADAALLERFVAVGDEAAFASLVGRYAQLVWGVCWRHLERTQDSEDAFQATFLVLARKAGRLTGPAPLGPWLHEVARRTAVKARTESLRRRARERTMPLELPAPEVVPDLLWKDLRPVLDEEVGRLPAKYRTPLVLCHLEGMTNEAAAARLGWPKGTVLSRLARGRELLRSRLARRGIGLSSAALAATLSENLGSAAVPPALCESTVRMGCLAATGDALHALSANSAVLAEGVLRSMLNTQLKIGAALLLTLGLVGSGVGLLARGVGADENAAVADTPPPKAPEKAPEKAVRRADQKVGAKVSIEEQARTWRDQFAQAVEFKGFDRPTTLAEALDVLAKQHRIQFEVNQTAFREQGCADVLQADITVNGLLAGFERVTLATALRLILDRLPVPATFLIRKDTVEITTVIAVRMELGIDNARPMLPLVWEEFENEPLADALRRLSSASGMNIVLDPRALSAEQAKITVNGQFANVPVETAVRVLANMADLQTVRLDNVLYVTSPKRAAQLQQEKKPDDEPAPRLPKQFGVMPGFGAG
jgi:RNA polymerase sigma factor (sigma-70 family)